jgi:hypothetical protein
MHEKNSFEVNIFVKNHAESEWSIITASNSILAEWKENRKKILIIFRDFHCDQKVNFQKKKENICSETVLQLHNITILQLHNITILQLHNITILQLHNITILQLHSITVLQLHSIAILQLHSITILQLHYITILQLHNRTIVQLHNITILQLHYITLTCDFSRKFKINSKF